MALPAKNPWALDSDPAAQVGLKKDGFITAVDGTPATKLSGHDLASNRPEGTRLRLTCADSRTVDIVLRNVAPK